MLVLSAFLTLAAAICAGVAQIFIRISTEHGNSNHALVVVMLINIVIIIPIAAIVSYPEYGINLESIMAFAAAGISGTMCGRAFAYMSIKRIGASRTEAIVASQPLYAVLIAVIILRESVTIGHFAGILLIMAGVGFLARECGSDSNSESNVAKIDFLLPFASAFFYGIEPIFAKIGLLRGTPVFVGLSIKTLVATTIFLGYLYGRQILPSCSQLRGTNLRGYMVAGLFNTLFLIFYYTALEMSPVVLVLPLIQIAPLIVIALSFIFLKRLEVVTWRLVSAATTVVIGAIVVTLSS